ncbi:MAG: sigma-70 family RNA polymerase sigma factor [Sphingobacteriales bacterium]|jgi:RNA polymerase sigma factor (sigma-70 family)|nr:sigma-70 family RNA polymerase sigma factor [Sphingobacteriales bacterium]MBP9141577.1 sigma-70 family RNA polymerase sigma factor [Chitinophagales bacterium]MDA0198680.1 sigma-70 family RNA polymerase sigma factor [Bacteroidota bacterium]MBK6889823.1 sigma-70 family RNA polymerase sigma factor [Sphingobacteriales bacterium]MBK7527658.1 sigma-70 family RNA polymerase sigma factor [Sphingobacteriales bacterium]
MTTAEYNQCVNLYADRVYRFAVKTLQNQYDANDITQTAFEILWKNVQNVPPEKAKSYLFSVAYKSMGEWFRKSNRMHYTSELPEYGEYQENSYRQADLQTLLHNALNTLNELQKSAILLCDYEGYSYKEIGDILSLSESQVKIYIFRGRQKLQRYLVSIQKVI